MAKQETFTVFVNEGFLKTRYEIENASAEWVRKWLTEVAPTDPSVAYMVRKNGDGETLSAAAWLVKYNPMVEAVKKYVPKFYRMDPETEDVLPDSESLANGMVVLSTKHEERMRPEKADQWSDWQEYRAEEFNQWCTVSQIEARDGTVAFVAIYPDGSKRARVYSINSSWYVKKSSVEAIHTREFAIRDAVKDVLLDLQEQYCQCGCDRSEDLTVDELAQRAMNFIREII